MPILGRDKNGIRAKSSGSVCQRGCWALKGVDCEIPHRMEVGSWHALYGCNAPFLHEAPFEDKTVRAVAWGLCQSGQYLVGRVILGCYSLTFILIKKEIIYCQSKILA